MSVYLPDINDYIYPEFSDELETRRSSHKKKKRRRAFTPLAPHDETLESSIVPLPDIRITDGHARHSNDAELADDRLAETLDENALRETLRRRAPFREKEGEGGDNLSPRGEQQAWGKRKLNRRNSWGRAFRDLNTSRQPAHVIDPTDRKFATSEQVSVMVMMLMMLMMMMTTIRR